MHRDLLCSCDLTFAKTRLVSGYGQFNSELAVTCELTHTYCIRSAIHIVSAEHVISSSVQGHADSLKSHISPLGGNLMEGNAWKED